MRWVCAGCGKPMRELTGMLVRQGEAYCWDCAESIWDDVWARIHAEEAALAAQKEEA